MVFTAVLAAIAVIAAMIAVPGARAKAEAGGQPVEIKANTTLGSETAKSGEGDPEWGTLTWAGERQEGGSFTGRFGNADNNVGWGWCVDVSKHVPNAARNAEPAYLLENARRAPIPEERRDAAINVATKMVQAAKSGDRETAKNYSFYLGALIGEESLSNDGEFLVGSAPDMRYYIGDPASPMNMKSDSILSQTFAGYTGSAEDFRKATGFKLVNGGRAWELEKDPSVDIPQAPDWAYITIVGQGGWYAMNRTGQADGVEWQRGQRIVTCLLYTSPSPRDS